MDSTYRFSDDGTFVCDTVSSSKLASYSFSGVRSSITGTWSYENGKITMFSNVPRVGATRERYNVIWYGKDEFELQVDATSIKDIRDIIGKTMEGLGWEQLSCEMTCLEKGGSASWSEYANKAGDRRYYATVWTPSLMKRAATEPCPAPSVRPADVPTAELGDVGHPPSAKWRLVEKKDEMEYRARFTFELAEGVSVEEADRGIRPWVRDDRERAFRQANPDVDPGSVQVMADHETPNGRTLVYTASAFTTQPVLLGFEYNDATRLGLVSVQIHVHGDKEAAYDFAKRIIGKIVTNANVALEVGKEAPPGAKYRELDKSFQGDVFTVKFEAIE